MNGNIQHEYSIKLRNHIYSLPYVEYKNVRQQLADLLKVDKSIVNNMIYGRKYIDNDTRNLMCKFFKKNIF